MFSTCVEKDIIMKENEKSIKESAKQALLSCLSEIPFIEAVDIQKGYRNETLQADISAEIRLPESGIQLVAEIKNTGQPRIARDTVNQLLRYKDAFPDIYPVFIAPYISDKAAEICSSEGVGYLDLSGNCLLVFDKIFIKKEGRPNKFNEKRELKSLYSPKAERILRVLLCNPGKKWKTQELADESRVSLGQVSNVKRLLYEREFISGERGGFKLEAPKTLLRQWSENYGYRKNVIREMYSLKSVSELEEAIALYCNRSKIPYAFTGFSGAARIAPSVRYQKAMIYAADLPETILTAVSLKPVNSGGNLLLFAPYDNGVFYGSFKIDDIQIASEVQIYLDLKGFRGRGEEAAEVVLERILDKSW